MIAAALAFALALAAPEELAFAREPSPAAAALEFRVPKNDGWVTDLADLLSPGDERALEARLEEWKQRTGHQVAVLTIPSLDGEALEEASLAVLRGWSVGTAERQDGALLFVARDDRKMRIEVGYGLEGALTDAVSGKIIREVVAPKFRSGDFTTGIRSGVESIVGVVEGGVDSVPALQGSGRGKAAGSGFAIFVVMIMIAAIAANARRSGRRRGWGSTGPFIPGGFGRGGFGGFSTRSGGGGGGFSGFGGGGGGGGGASGGW